MEYYTDEIISLETAKLGKSIDSYNLKIKTNLFYTPKGGLDTIMGLVVDGIKEKDCFQAPSQSLVHKWLRKEFKFFIKISNWEGERWYFEIQDFEGRYSMNELKTKFLDREFEFNSYEEALEVGLQCALTLLINE